MKYLITAFLLCASTASLGNNLEALVDELQSRELSLETIAALVQLDNPRLKVGYGLCREKGSLGYGLCVMAGEKNCKP